MSPEASSETSSDQEFRKIQFKGNATTYFGIWISNLVLTIVTLGIYSAWAKVRRIQYFYSHTEIANFKLGYHATGIQLLIGRLITVGVLGIFSIISILYPEISFVLSFALIFVLPWIINRSLKFRSRMTSWRNVRFNWHGNYWRTLLFFVVYPVLSVITLSLFTPVSTKYHYEYYSKNHAFGTTKFHAQPTMSAFFKAYFLSVQLPVIVAIAAVIGLAMYVLSPTPEALTIFVPIVGVIFIFGLVLYFALCRNILLETLALDESVKFKADLNPFIYLWINISNSIAIIFSLGLLIPWATVRKFRYLCEHTGYLFLKDESEFIDEELQKIHAFGEEYVDWEGFEISV